MHINNEVKLLSEMAKYNIIPLISNVDMNSMVPQLPSGNGNAKHFTRQLAVLKSVNDLSMGRKVNI